MTDREMLYKGLSHAAWGYFFLNFHLKLNNVDVLPSFVGFLLLLSAIGRLSGERRDLALLRPICVLLAVWDGADWLFSWVGGTVSGHITPLDLLIAAAALYFHFQFLTDMAALAEAYQPKDSGLDERLRRRRTVYLVVMTALSLISGLPVRTEAVKGWWTWIAMGLMIVAMIASLTIMAGLFSLRKCVKDGKPESA